jgi:hypothetical protein
MACSKSMILNLWIMTQNSVAGNIEMGWEYITLFFMLNQTLIKVINVRACGK